MKQFLLFLSGLLLMSLVYSQKTYTKQIDELLTFYQKNHLFNGSVLVSKNGQILVEKGFGLANFTLNKKNTPKSIFQIYSITKTFTSSVILKLVEENKLSLSDHLSKFYPNYPQGDSITIEHLLTHTSGIYDYTRGNNMPDQTEKSFVEFEKTKPLDFKPGTNWNYSNSNYYFLGFIIQKITGLSYEKAVAEYIFNPLRMTQSGFAFKNLNSENKAIGYEVFTAINKKESMVYEPPGPFAAGGIYSTIEDLYKYYNGLKSFKILKKETLEKAYTPYQGYYGYGWMVNTMFNKKTIGHSGWGAGFTSQFIQIDEDKACIIILSNVEKDLNTLVGNILKILNNKPIRIPKEVFLEKEELRKFEGTYKVDDMAIYVSIQNNRLIAQPTQQAPNIFYPEKNNRFYSMELGENVYFKMNKLNEIDTLIFVQNGKTIKAKRIKVTWGLIGSATLNGWEGADVELSETDKRGVWHIKNVKLKDGEFKFRFNSDWTINLGEGQNGELKQDGGNFKIKKGLYDITLDLSQKETPKLKITGY